VGRVPALLNEWLHSIKARNTPGVSVVVCGNRVYDNSLLELKDIMIKCGCIPKSSMTIEQFIADLNELVDLICERFGKNKISIFGHSWGSVLGILYSVRFPQKVAVYVGCGQYGNWSAAESASYAYAMTEAQRLNNRKALKELNATGPPPYCASSLLKERTWLQRFEGQLRPRALWNMARIFLGGPESSIFDIINILKGFQFTLNAMWDEVSWINLLKDAPSKKLVWFEKSGHEPFADEPEKFNKTMIELVLPVVAST
jgi:pimeloyl-ACP methyl ester carboxylesterase